MKMFRLILLCLCFTPSMVLARPVPPSFADLVETLSPAVVNISTKQKVQDGPKIDFNFKGLPDGDEFKPFKEFFEKFGERMQPPGGGSGRDVTSLGSGFVIDPKGFIVTNNHVIADGKEIQVTFQDETSYSAKVLGRDPKTDMALIKIESDKPFPYVSFGNSDKMRVGDWVIAIGNPFGLGGSVSAGIISARSRNINAGPFDDFIQTDAAINRGNSGGPLFNIYGEVIGVNSAIFSPSGGNVGIGFAVPSALVEPVLTQLKEHGRTYRGWLGVKIQHVTEEMADGLGMDKPRGALVLEVTPDGPAADAGLESGDVITEFDGKRVEEMRTLPRMVAETKVGKKVRMKVLRKGREKSLSITLGEMDEESDFKVISEDELNESMPEPEGEEFLNMTLETVTSMLGKRYSLDDSLKGVLVLDIDRKSSAVEKLRAGDVIVQANQEDIEDVAEFKKAIRAARKQGKKHALLRIVRGKDRMFVTIETAEK